MTSAENRRSATHGTGELSAQELSFSLTSDPIIPAEQSVFADDLARLGVNESVWGIFNSVLETSTLYSTPLTLRGYSDGALAGISLIYECKKTGQSFFDPPLSTLYDMPGLPTFIWLRYGVTVDHFANPGFVAKTMDREQFVEQAITYLLQQYMVGNVVEYAASPTRGNAVKFPFADTGLIDVSELASLDDFTSRGKNLKRKLKKFRNKGGEIQLIEGSMPSFLRDAALNAFETLDYPVRTPFQDNYLNMANAGMSLDSPDMVHFVALLEGEYVGHQSFCRAGDQIHCQAGAFDRRRKSTYHAYENIIVTSVEYALDQDLWRIDYGPVLNETKAKLMTRFIQCENRTYVRYRPMAAALPLLIGRSKLSPERLAPWTGLGEPAALSFV
jgi:hypothetical protein